MTEKIVRQMSVDGLLRIFRTGLCALVPIFESAGISWREPDAYDDWDETASMLYNSLVCRAIEFAKFSSPIRALIPYDKRVNSYSEFSVICDANSDEHTAFICFETHINPFDTCLFAKIKQTGEFLDTYQINIDNVFFEFTPRDKAGILKQKRRSIFEV